MYVEHQLLINLWILGVCTAIGLVFLLTRDRHVTCCGQLLNQMHPHQLAGLDDIAKVVNAAAHWKATHGLRGLWRRWRNHSVLMQICQLRAECDEEISDAEIRYVMERAAVMTRASLLAALWGCLRYISPQRAIASGNRVLLLYRELAYQTYAILADGTGQMCGERLAELL